MALDDATLSVSVVIPALNEGQNLIDTVHAVRANSAPLTPQIIVVDDGSTDGAPGQLARELAADPTFQILPGPRQGIARARNAGAGAAQGQAVVFLDGHCFVPQGWLAPLIGPLSDPTVAMTGPTFRSIRNPDARACGVTWAEPTLGNVWLPAAEGNLAPTPVPFHIGACQAVRADVFAALGGFDQGMTRWGSEDIELCLRAWLMGYQVLAAPASEVYHLFRDARPYDVDVALILYNHLRLAALHLDEARLAAVIARMMQWQDTPRALARVMADGTMADRARLMSQRRHDADWFFAHFGIGF